MQCREAREFFSPYLDGELATEEMEVLQQHLEGCPACREELARWRKLSLALQGLKAPVAAPPGFATAANARLAERQRVRPWRGIRRWAAAAAAVAVLAAGSIGYAARGIWQHLPAPVASVQHSDGRQVAVDNPVPNAEPPASNLLPDSGTSQTVKPDGRQPGGGETPGKDTAPVIASSGKESSKPADGAVTPTGNGNSGGQPAQVAAAEPYVARAFLGDRRQATSTMLKITVADMAVARARALSLAAGSGADTQVIADQDNGQEKRIIYTFKVAEGQAAALLDGLSQLGQVISKNTTTLDLTEQFSATLEQYQAKVAQVNAAADSAEKEKLAKEAKALEQQLSTWEEETKQHTIILWLETN
ncbi:zf-HC2 domain-containing protein [Moorella sp. E306M]|uniref:zf-HC2 domain-containing protein n=1 Tax=Moorella sp. E306M TaxID=2572683 RepID=UPI0010FFBACC|nr:zf-HC2 domain-containing protein [Moorella sp. E306M]GEA18331.1 transcriptional regulator [Moorella sp. E306M]